jgi:methyltransferase (TIGR00027 family)
MIFAFPPTGVAVRQNEISLSAEISAAQRAVGAKHPDERLRNPDYLAWQFVSDEFWHYYHYSRDFDASMAFVKTFRVGGYYYANARARHMDKLLKSALIDGSEQVVILGAGFDTRAYRFGKDHKNVRFFELDHPPTALRKQELLKKHQGKIPLNVAFVPIDFNSWIFEDALGTAGYDPGKITCFIWSGGSMYSTKAAVQRTLRFIASQSMHGSSVILDYIPEPALKGDPKRYPGARRVAFRMSLAGEPLLSSLPENLDTVQSFFDSCGLEVISNVGTSELTKMYLIGSDGTLDGQASNYYRIVHARVPKPGP